MAIGLFEHVCLTTVDQMANNSRLADRMFAAFQRGEGDVKVVASLSGQKIHSYQPHKCVLTLQSDFFQRCLNNAANFKEGADGEVVLELDQHVTKKNDIASADRKVVCQKAMEQLFYYLYHDSFEEGPLKDVRVGEALCRLFDFILIFAPRILQISY